MKEVTDFIERVGQDARTGPLHVSLYIAILYGWLRQGRTEPVKTSAKELMVLAKIGGPTAMYKTLRELHDYGYIDYQPSFNPQEKSKIYLPLVKNIDA